MEYDDAVKYNVKLYSLAPQSFTLTLRGGGGLAVMEYDDALLPNTTT